MSQHPFMAEVESDAAEPAIDAQERERLVPVGMSSARREYPAIRVAFHVFASLVRWHPADYSTSVIKACSE